MLYCNRVDDCVSGVCMCVCVCMRGESEFCRVCSVHALFPVYKPLLLPFKSRSLSMSVQGVCVKMATSSAEHSDAVTSLGRTGAL